MRTQFQFIIIIIIIIFITKQTYMADSYKSQILRLYHYCMLLHQWAEQFATTSLPLPLDNLLYLLLKEEKWLAI